MKSGKSVLGVLYYSCRHWKMDINGQICRWNKQHNNSRMDVTVEKYQNRAGRLHENKLLLHQLCLSPQHERSQCLASTDLWWADSKGCCICKDRKKIIIYVHANLDVLILPMWYCEREVYDFKPSYLILVCLTLSLQFKPTQRKAKSRHHCATIATQMLNGSARSAF